jgi:hypothetical protein
VVSHVQGAIGAHLEAVGVAQSPGDHLEVRAVGSCS